MLVYSTVVNGLSMGSVNPEAIIAHRYQWSVIDYHIVSIITLRYQRRHYQGLTAHRSELISSKRRILMRTTLGSLGKAVRWLGFWQGNLKFELSYQKTATNLRNPPYLFSLYFLFSLLEKGQVSPLLAGRKTATRLVAPGVPAANLATSGGQHACTCMC